MNKVESRPQTAKARGVTIVDVARRAGVSTATVSRALAFPDRVAKETRSLVLRAIAEIGYTPNAAARNLRAKSTRMVLALVPGMTNTFFTPILNAVEDELSDAGYGLIIGDTRAEARKEAHYARLIHAGQVDGVILLTGHLPRDDNDRGIEGLLPIALVCVEIKDSGLPVFDVANRAAARKMVDYLISQGHREIAHLRGPRDNAEAQERVRGYADALKAASLTVRDDLIWPGSFLAPSGEAAAKHFLGMPKRPTAIFAASDEMAIGFIKEVKDAGLSVPGDVSVAGFDDIAFLELFMPALTTMRQPRAELGRLAAADLLKRMVPGVPALPATRARLDCELIIRDSVRAITAPRRRRNGATTGAPA